MLKFIAGLSFAFFLSQFAFSQVEEASVDFKINSPLILNNEIQVAYEWLSPSEFKEKKLSIIDHKNVHLQTSKNIQVVAAKMSFITEQTFEELSHKNMNNADYIFDMLNSVGIRQVSSETWRVTNKVKAYGLPFKVSFDFDFQEVSKLPQSISKYYVDQTVQFSGSGRERFLILDMTNFTQLIYRNYAIIYIKELKNGHNLIVSGVITAINLDRANHFFNYPPFSRTETAIMNNLRNQILHMAFKIQNPD